jgi:hypothetical protein
MNFRRLIRWVSAGAVSVALHVVAVVGAGWLMAPKPVEDQTLPHSQINIQAQEVKQVDAREEAAPAEQVNETATDAEAAIQGEVPQTKAIAINAQSEPAPAKDLDPAHLRAAQPKTQKTMVAPAPSQVIASATLQAQSIQANVEPRETISAVNAPVQTATTLVPTPSQGTAAITPTSSTLVSTSPNQTKAIALPPPGQTSAAVLPASTQITAIFNLPTSEPTEVTPTETTAASAVPSTPVTLAAVANQSEQASTLPLVAIAGKAALAWSGNEEEQVEATSLAAIQAFMRPGDLNTSDSDIGDVRDGITAILAAVPCSRLQTTFIPETGQLELRGHIPEDALRKPVLAALQKQLGDAIPVSDQLLILPRPQCRTIDQPPRRWGRWLCPKLYVCCWAKVGIGTRGT